MPIHRINDQFETAPRVLLTDEQSNGLRRLIEAHPRILDALEAQTDAPPAILSDEQFARLTSLLESQRAVPAVLSDEQYGNLAALIEAQGKQMQALVQLDHDLVDRLQADRAAFVKPPLAPVPAAAPNVNEG